MRYLFLALLIISINIHAECNFITSNFINEMASPENINSIDIEIPKSAKYAKNTIKIITSKSDTIPNALKKKFKAKVAINYEFGTCRYKAKVRQSGDFKDHIKVENGNPVQSLDLALQDGNVMGATRFKLLIPETRNGKHEILATIILRELDFIAPETFEVNASVNGIKSIMLFQEKPAKELLERNLRREGPIYEGDESILWNFPGFANDRQLEPLALSRLSNDNWFKKGLTSQKIVIKSFNRLQKSYLEYARSNFLKKNLFYIDPNKLDVGSFNNFHWLLIAMNGAHALHPHNRQYYFNAIEDRFEPIYYDGNVSFNTYKPYYGFPTKTFFALEKLSPDLKDRVNKLLSSNDVEEKFLKRLKTITFDKSFVTKSLNHIINNFKLLNTEHSFESKSDWYLLTKTDDYSWYFNYQSEKKVSQNIIENIQLNRDNATLQLTDHSKRDLSISDLANILSNNNFQDERYVFIPNSHSTTSTEEYKEVEVAGNVIRFSDGIKIVVDEGNRKLEFYQTNPYDWALLLNGDYTNWKIKFNGAIKSNTASNIDEQRFNDFGLTGCLTLYQSIIDNALLEVSNGQCEDSLNFIRVQGVNLQIRITDAFADGLDADFSNLNISKLQIMNAGNDCFDVSGGFYKISIVELKNCPDKAISIGEMSSFEGNDVIVKESGIGVSSKDFSRVKIETFNVKDTPICGEAKRKKQEFGGGVLMIKEVTCLGEYNKDNESSITIGNI